LAFADINHITNFWWFISCNSRIGYSTIYIYNFLNMNFFIEFFKFAKERKK
jgi:hypothetical protein